MRARTRGIAVRKKIYHTIEADCQEFRAGRETGRSGEPTGEFSNVCWHDTRDLLSRGSDRLGRKGDDDYVHYLYPGGHRPLKTAVSVKPIIVDGPSLSDDR